MQFIDTHCHIYLEEFENDMEKIIQAAEDMGIVKMLMPAIDSATHAGMIELEKMNKELCKSMMGLHPCSVKENFEEELKLVSNYLETGEFVAIGEIGLDFYWDLTFKEQQMDAFKRQIEWALQYDLPIAIHSRNSLDECIDMVSQLQNGKLKGVFHCFSGTVEQALKIETLNFYMGIGGVVTYKNSGLDMVIKEIGLKRVVLETDSPYLTPVPFRGKRNQPAYLKYIAEKLSAITGTTTEDVAKITTQNAQNLFGL